MGLSMTASETLTLSMLVVMRRTGSQVLWDHTLHHLHDIVTTASSLLLIPRQHLNLCKTSSRGGMRMYLSLTSHPNMSDIGTLLVLSDSLQFISKDCPGVTEKNMGEWGSPYGQRWREASKPGYQVPHRGHDGVLKPRPKRHQTWPLHDPFKILHTTRSGPLEGQDLTQLRSQLSFDCMYPGFAPFSASTWFIAPRNALSGNMILEITWQVWQGECSRESTSRVRLVPMLSIVIASPAVT